MKPENSKQMFEITTAIHQNDIDVPRFSNFVIELVVYTPVVRWPAAFAVLPLPWYLKLWQLSSPEIAGRESRPSRQMCCHAGALEMVLENSFHRGFRSSMHAPWPGVVTDFHGRNVANHGCLKPD